MPGLRTKLGSFRWRSLEPDASVADCPDDADNRILEAALASGELLVVANEPDLVHISPWKAPR